MIDETDSSIDQESDVEVKHQPRQRSAWTEGNAIQSIWWFAAQPEWDIKPFWTVRGAGDTWSDDPTVFKIDVAM